MTDPSEAGLLEMSQIALLAFAAGVFLLTGLKTRQAGAPALAAFTLVLGAVALREYSPEITEGWRHYLSSHAARWHFVALAAAAVAVLGLRDRQFDVWSHARAVAWLIPFFLLGVGLVVVGGVLENWSDTMVEAAPERVWLHLIEEMLELAAYGLILLGSVLAFRRMRREGCVSGQSLTAPGAIRSWRERHPRFSE